MDPASRETLHIIEGKWHVTLATGTRITLIAPTLNEELSIESASARAYHTALEEGVAPLATLLPHVKRACEEKGIPYAYIENKRSALAPLLKSDEYHALLLESKDLTEDAYARKLADLFATHIDEETRDAIAKADTVYQGFYRQSAEYFANVAKLRAMTYYAVYDEKGETRYFSSVDAVGCAEKNVIREILFRVREFIAETRDEAFFFLS